MDFLADVNWIYMLFAAFAGGAFGAAIGALPAFVFTGFMVIAGEASGTGAVTGDLGFGYFFGPHISFAGGAAAAAYAAKQNYLDDGKNIAAALGTDIDVLAVGGLFGIFGAIFQLFMAGFGLPLDTIALTVVASALLHRVVFGYSLIGSPAGGFLDVGDTNAWLPHQYKWSGVAGIGLITGLLGGFTALATGSPFMAFGISAASLLFLNLGVEKIPVTHHMTLPAATIAIAVTATGDGVTASAALAGTSEVVGLVMGGLFGVICALFGELFERVFYAHGDTHVDPPAAAIVFGTILIALLYFSGIIGSASWVA